MGSDEIIPLSRWRAALARARRGKKADAILSEPDAQKLVPRLPVQELYYAVKEVGLADAEELVALATPEQVQGFVDLDVWERDHLDEQRLDAWVQALAAGGPDTLGRAIDGLDAEVVALWLQRQARVYDLSLEEPPNEPEGHYYPTPDRFFLLDILVGGEVGKALERAIDYLYRYDLELGRRVVMSAKWELDSALEEEAYRFRKGRMADLGYVDFYEALSLYRYLDPRSVTLDEHTFVGPPEDGLTTLPAVLAQSLDDAGFFGRALSTLESDAAVERLHGALVLVVNKAMAADLVDPGDVEEGKAALSRAVAYLGLGLEYLSRGDVAAAGRALREIALERIFRVGFSLTVQLKTLAEALVARGLHPATLEPPYDALVRALTLPKPQFPRALDGAPEPDGPRAGGRTPGEGTRAFATLSDVARAAAALEKVSTGRKA